MRTIRVSAEHTTIELREPSAAPGTGDHLELVVGNSDTTVNLHDELVAVRRGRIEAVWKIAGRGKIR